MRTFALERTQVVGAPIEEAWAFYGEPRNLEAITPPWLRFRIVESPPELGEGAFIRYRLTLFGVPIRWLTEIVRWQPPHTFVDVQRSGPYLLWEHTHRLTPVDGGTEIHDHVRYRVPGGRPVDAVVRRLLAAIFDHRTNRTAELISQRTAQTATLGRDARTRAR